MCFPQINQALTETVQKIIFDYGNSSDINDRMMDAMQKTVRLVTLLPLLSTFLLPEDARPVMEDVVAPQGRCCGLNGASNWLGNSFVQTLNLSAPDVLPCSCFESHSPSFNSSWCSENPEFLSAAIGGGANVFKEVLQFCNERRADLTFETTESLD